MQNIESLLQQLDKDCDLAVMRNAIADLMIHHLEAMNHSLGYWETAHFANAIAALAMSMCQAHQPTTAWLRLCLVDLEKVLMPPNRRHEDSLLQDKQLESLTYEQLMATIKSIRAKN